MWGMSWNDFIMDLAAIPDSGVTEKTNNKESEGDVVVAPEDEEAELRKLLG